MKSPIIKLTFSLLLLTIVIPMTAANINHQIKGSIDVTYTVNKSNNATNIWWDPETATASNYYIENSTMITLRIANVSNPQSLLDLTIGNLTKLQISDTLAEEVLSFGYWMVPATFGFIANNSWTQLKLAMDQIGLNSFNFSLSQKNYLGGEVDTAIFEFADDFQQTQLVYDQTNGMLLEAYSKVFGFELSILIRSINGDSNFHQSIESSKSNADAPFVISWVMLFISAPVIYKKKLISRKF